MDLHFNPERVKRMSPETQAKGEAFIKALIEEGHTYDSMKAGFLTCMICGGLQQGNGVMDRAAALLKTHRNNLFNIVAALKLQNMVKQIRAEAAAK